MPQNRTGGSLADFTFNEEQDFFGISAIPKEEEEPITRPKPKDNGKAPKAGEIKEVPEGEEPEEVDDDENVTFFETPASAATKKKLQPKAEPEGDDDEPPKEVEKPKEKPKEKTKLKPKPEEEEEPDEGEEGDEGADAELVDDDVDDEEFYTELAKENKERGVFQNIELPKDKKITEDEFFELQDAEIEARVDETFESFFEEMDDDGKEFLKFKKSGGSTREFLTQYLQPDINLDDFDEDKPEQVRQVNEYYMRFIEGKDEEEIQDGLGWLKDNGKEKTYAAKRFAKIKDAEKRRKEAILENVKQASDKREQDVKDFNADLIEVLSNSDKIGDFPISKVEQKELGAYITKPTIKIGKNKYVPPFQAKVAQIFRAATEKDKQHLILLAKLIKNDFDVSDLVTETQTKVTRKAKSTLNKIKRGVKPTSSGNYATRQLSDYFTDDR